MQMHFGLQTKFPIVRNSSYKACNFLAKMVTVQSGKPNFYQLLSLDSNDVGFDEIKKAYRCKALKYHPDICHESKKEESTRQFLGIKQAYEILSDPISREIYDYELGLTESMRKKYGRWSMERRRGADSFSRELWERQLQELKIRSLRKMERRRNQSL